MPDRVLGNTASGASTGASIGSIVPGVGTVVGGLAGGAYGLVKGLFSHGQTPAATGPTPTGSDALKSTLQQNSTNANARGDTASAVGEDALRPAIDYFQKILSGDPNALLAATQPERARVIDQYDNARRNLNQFGARGGGTNAAVAGSQFAQASDLSNITATARREAAPAAATLGTAEQQIGVAEHGNANTAIANLLQHDLGEKQIDAAKRGQNLAALGDLGKVFGTFLRNLSFDQGGATGGTSSGNSLDLSFLSGLNPSVGMPMTPPPSLGR